MAKGKGNGKGKQPQNRRKIGERVETVTHKLTPMEVDEERARVCDLLRDLDKLEEERKSITAGVKAKIAERRAELREAAAVANSARRDVEVTIEEWLTSENEVLRIRADTGEILGQRTARIDELQEEMDLPEPEPKLRAVPPPDESSTEKAEPEFGPGAEE